VKHVYDLSGKTPDEVKNDVLIQLYRTGRIQGNYFGIKSKSKANPIKGYINNFLKKNNLADLDLDLCEECYQLTFQHLWNKSAEKIVEIIKESPSKLTATALRIVINQCFAIKPNSKSSGLFHNILEKSGYSKINDQINANENTNDPEGDNAGKPLILIDDSDEQNDFQLQYGFPIEDIISRFTEEDKDMFYRQLDKQSVGRPSAKTVAERKELYARINKIKKEIDNENNR
jgi:hypothetical protein